MVRTQHQTCCINQLRPNYAVITYPRMTPDRLCTVEQALPNCSGNAKLFYDAVRLMNDHIPHVILTAPRATGKQK